MNRPPLLLALVLGLAYWTTALLLLLLGLARAGATEPAAPGSSSAYTLVLAGGAVLEAGNQVWSRSAADLDLRPVEGVGSLALVVVALLAAAFPGGLAGVLVAVAAVVALLVDLRTTPGRAQVARGFFLVFLGVFAVAALILSVGETTSGSTTSDVLAMAVLALVVWITGVATSETARRALDVPEVPDLPQQ